VQRLRIDCPLASHYDVQVFRIPVARPELGGNEEAYVVDAIRSTWISSTGPYLERFEADFAAACGAAASIGVTNGTVALHLAMLALGLGPDDQVIVPSLTYIATANAVRYVGAEPVFVDVDPQTWCIDPQLIESAITPRTRGIIAVHLYGHPADMDAINRIAGIHGLWVVEDAAEAPFGRYKGRPTGSLGRIGTFSFYGNKIITSGEGGAVTVNDPHLELRLRTLRGQGMDPQRRYFFPVTGYNFRLTNIAAAMLCAQLERASEMVEGRRRIYAAYESRLANVSGVELQPRADWAEISPWLFSVTIDEQRFGRSRDELMAFLAEAGIETRPFFIPLHQLPPFRAQSRARNEQLPVTDALGSCGLNLPTYVGLTESDIDEICSLVRAAAR
jgi:perosamine synthetase